MGLLDSGSNGRRYRRRDAFGVRDHSRSGEPQDQKSPLLEITLAYFIFTSSAEVNRPINFDDETSAGTVEIDDERFDDVLASPFGPAEFNSAEPLPQKVL